MLEFCRYNNKSSKAITSHKNMLKKLKPRRIFMVLRLQYRAVLLIKTRDSSVNGEKYFSH